MRKNKLTLTASILMIVVAAFSIVSTIGYGVAFAKVVATIYAMEGGIPVNDIDLLLGVLSLLGWAIIHVAEGVLYLVSGIVLLRKTNKYIPVSKMKGFVVTMTVFSYVIAFIQMGKIGGTVALFLAVAILLTIALSKDSEHNPQAKETVLDRETVEKMTSIKKLYDDKVIDEEEYKRLRDKVLSDIVNLDK